MSITLLGFIGFLQNASAEGGTISDQASCETFSGTWNAANSVCTIPDTLVINQGETLIIDSGTTLDIPDFHTLTNMGTINNHGTISISEFAGSECIDDAGRLEIHGPLNNYGTIKNSGGTFEMIYHTAVELLNNSGEIENLGVIAILYGGTIFNSGSINNHGTFTDCDGFTQNARITISADINNSGNIDNSGEIEILPDGNIFNDCEGIIDGNPTTGKQPSDVCVPTDSDNNEVPSSDNNEVPSSDNNEVPSSDNNVVPSSDNNDNETSPQIPQWIRNNAEFWASGAIEDKDFLAGIQYLIQEKIILIPDTVSSGVGGSQDVPTWVKFNAEWWAQGLIPDDGFLQGIQYLVEQGIIKI